MEEKFFHDELITENEGGVHLIAHRCTKCGNIQYPQKDFCYKCLSDELEEVPAGHTGKLFSYTTTYGKVQKLEGPLSVGYIDIPEGLRIFAPLKTPENAQFFIGADVELETAPLWEEDGISVIGYRYRLKEDLK